MIDFDAIQDRLLRKAAHLRKMATLCGKKADNLELTDRDQQGWHTQYRNHLDLALKHEAEARAIDRHVGKKAIAEYEGIADGLDSRVKALHGGRPRRKPAPEPH